MDGHNSSDEESEASDSLTTFTKPATEVSNYPAKHTRGFATRKPIVPPKPKTATQNATQRKLLPHLVILNATDDD